MYVRCICTHRTIKTKFLSKSNAEGFHKSNFGTSKFRWSIKIKSEKWQYLKNLQISYKL